MAYSAWSVTSFEVPTAAKWNILGTNDAEFNSMIKHNGTIVEVAASGDTSIDIPVNNIPLRQDNSSGTPQDLLKVDASNILQVGDSDLSGMSLNGLIWGTWSPTLTNITIGDGSIQARYTQVGKLVCFRLKLGFGSTTSFSGSPTFSLPVTAVLLTGTSTEHFGTGIALDAGGAAYMIRAYLSSATAVVAHAEVASGTYLTNAAMSATVPFTWATGDLLQINGTYEAA